MHARRCLTRFGNERLMLTTGSVRGAHSYVKSYRLIGGGRGTSRCGKAWKGSSLVTEDGYKMETDTPTPMGGSGRAPQPVQLVLTALAGCEQATARFVARHCRPRINIAHIEFDIQGERDQRGAVTLPLDIEELPAPARLMRIWGTAVVFGSDASEQQVHLLGDEVHRRCPVANMISLSGCELSIDWRLASPEEEAAWSGKDEAQQHASS